MHKLFIVVCVTVMKFAYCGRQYNLPYDDGIFLKGAQIGLGISVEKAPPGKYDKDDYHDSQIVIVKPGEDNYGKFGYGYEDQPYKKNIYESDIGYGSRLEKVPVYSLDKYPGLSKLGLNGGGYGKGAALYADEPVQEKGYDSGYAEGLSVIPGKFKEIFFDGGYGKLDFKKYAPAKAYASSKGFESYAPSKKYLSSAEGFESYAPPKSYASSDEGFESYAPSKKYLSRDEGYESYAPSKKYVSNAEDYLSYAPSKKYISSADDYQSYAPPKTYAPIAEGYESGKPLDLSGYGKGVAVPSYTKAAQMSEYGREDLRAAYSKAYDRLAEFDKEVLPVGAFSRAYDAGYDEEEAPRYADRRY